MILPDYSGGSIVNLMSSIEQAMGSGFDLYSPARALPVAELQQCESLVLLVIDGLGYDYLTTEGKGSHLHSHLKSSLTSVCPSTTAAAVPTFLTGVAPQQHAFTGWFTWFREMGTVLSVLPFQPRHGGCSLGQLGFTPGALSDTKLYAVINHLVNGNRPNRFQAERVCGGHPPPSTVTASQRTIGIMVARKLISVPGYQGLPTAVALYWLEADERARAKKLLEVA